MTFNISPERLAQLEAQAIAEAEAEFSNEIAAETQAAFEKAYMAAVKAQKLTELRANKAQRIQKTVYDMLENAGISKEASDFLKVHEAQQKALAQEGKTISRKDNQTVVDSSAVTVLKNLGYTDAEIREFLAENPEMADSEYDEIRDIAADWIMERRSRNMVSFDGTGSSPMDLDEKISMSF